MNWLDPITRRRLERFRHHRKTPPDDRLAVVPSARRQGIADFDGGGIHHLTSGVSFAIFQAFDTWASAFSHLQFFYRHIPTQADLDHMNSNCCHDSSNLNNPSPNITNHIGNIIM